MEFENEIFDWFFVSLRNFDSFDIEWNFDRSFGFYCNAKLSRRPCDAKIARFGSESNSFARRFDGARLSKTQQNSHRRFLRPNWSDEIFAFWRQLEVFFHFWKWIHFLFIYLFDLFPDVEQLGRVVLFEFLREGDLFTWKVIPSFEKGKIV